MKRYLMILKNDPQPLANEEDFKAGGEIGRMLCAA